LPAWESSALAKCISKSKMLVCNDYEMEMTCNSTGMSREQVAGTVETIIVTKGGEGCDILTASGTVEVPVVLADDAVDPTGAGDVFAAAFLIRLHETGDPWEAGRFANVVASFSVEKPGVKGIPERSTVEEWLEKHGWP